jgi:hypothetical protein
MESARATRYPKPAHKPAHSALPFPLSPLRTIREEQGLTTLEFARRHRVNHFVIQIAEKGCYTKPPTIYQRYSPSLKLYQEFRREARLWHFPEPPPFTEFQEFYDAYGSDFNLGIALAIQPSEVFRVKKHYTYRLPANFRQALIDIGVDPAPVELSLLIGVAKGKP